MSEEDITARLAEIAASRNSDGLVIDPEISYDTDGFAVIWSESDGEYVGLCERYPSISWLAPTSQEAMTGIRERVAEVSID